MRIGSAVAAIMFVGGCMPGKSFTGPLPAATPVQVSLANETKADVTLLAGTIGHRDTYHPENLTRAADYIERELQRAGLKVVRHPYKVGNQTVYNLDAEIKGE